MLPLPGQCAIQPGLKTRRAARSPVAIEARPEQPARQAPLLALALTTPPKRRAQAHHAPVGRRMAHRHVAPRFRVCEFQVVKDARRFPKPFSVRLSVRAEQQCAGRFVDQHRSGRRVAEHGQAQRVAPDRAVPATDSAPLHRGRPRRRASRRA